MKTTKSVLKYLIYFTLFWCALNLHAQPIVTNQPASQTNLPGTTVNFSVGVSGAGPFTFQWQFNGTNLPNNIITTVAGNGTAKFAGDLGAATNASLNVPRGVGLDSAGNLYIADIANNRIRKVDTNGIITTVAGGGSGGDGGAATNASLSVPTGVASDVAGNLYIAETGNGFIRKVDTNGIISTIAGGGSGGDGGAATNANLHNPTTVYLDAVGNMFIADSVNNRIRKVDTNGIITTVAGGGSGGDGGPATNASLNLPFGITCDAIGEIYIGDYNNYRVRKVDTNGIITTVAGSGNYGFAGDGNFATNASLSTPAGVTLDALGNVYFADLFNHCIRKVDLNGIITTVAGDSGIAYSGDGGAATNASLGVCYSVALDTYGNLFIADTGNNRIRKVLLYAEYPTLTVTSLGALNAGNYTVVITSSYGSVTSSIAALVVQAPPIITVQPTNQIVVDGSSSVMQVAVAGSGPFGYSWFLANTNLVQSGTNSTLLLNNISTNNAGDYTVIITNNYGSVTSQVATLVVAIPPSVTSMSGSQTVVAGTNTTFCVTASGTGPLIYHWRLNGTNLIETMNAVAGTGQYGFFGDGGQATNAYLRGPNAATADAYGNIFIADWGNNRVREVATNGIITTIAGNGTTAGSLNGRAATNTGIYNPASMCVDAMGNLFVAQNGSSYISKIGTNGILNNVVGEGAGLFGGDGGPATNAYINGPYGIAFDALGNLFIADTGNNRIRKVNSKGIITTVAGKMTWGFSGDGGPATNAILNTPWGVFVDNSGDMFIADSGNNRIREIGTNGIITTIAGNGTAGFSGDGGMATNASLNHPDAVALDGLGNLLIADAQNNRVRQIDPTGVITTLAGGSATSGYLYDPSCVAVDPNGNILIDNNYGDRIQELSAWWPSLLLTNVGAANAGNYSVVITSPYGSVTSAVVTLTVLLPPTITTQPASQTNLLGTPVSFSVTANGTGPFTYQWQFNGTNLPNNIINTIAGGGSGGREPFPATNASLNQPWGIAFDASENLYFADNGFNRIRKVDTNGMFTTFAGGNDLSNIGDGGAATNATLAHPQGVTFNAFGNLFISDTMNNRVRKVDINGIIITVAGTNMSSIFSGDGGAATNASLNEPSGVACDAFGNLYIADMNHNRIRMVNTNGIITTVAGTNGLGKYAGDGGAATKASLNSPNGVVIDVAGNLYIADTGNSRIRMVNTNGIITTVAGTNGAGYSGDGGAATNASLFGPRGVIFDASGNLYIADTGNSRIRMVDTNGIITTVVGNGNAAFAGDGDAATNASLSHPTGVALDASGNLYIADNVNNRIREVYLAGHPVFTLTDVSDSSAGNYSVVITSPYGSVTSAVVSLTVTIPNPPPQIIVNDGSFGFTTNQSGFGFDVNGAVSQIVVVDGSTNLVNWIPLFTNILSSSSPFYFFDPVWTNFPARFYRARLQ